MPHLKCEACRVRVRSARDATAQTAHCPLCGGPLESVGALTEIVGFKAVAPAPSGESPAFDRRLAEEVAKVMARRRAAAARSWSEPPRGAP